MDLKQIKNQDELDQNIDKLSETLQQQLETIDKSASKFFESNNNNNQITCPFCDEKFDPVEAGLDPSKTWEDFNRSQMPDLEAIGLNIRADLGSCILKLLETVELDTELRDRYLILLDASVKVFETIIESEKINEDPSKTMEKIKNLLKEKIKVK